MPGERDGGSVPDVPLPGLVPSYQQDRVAPGIKDVQTSLMTAALVRIPPVLYLRLDGDKAPHPPEFGRLAVAGHELHLP